MKSITLLSLVLAVMFTPVGCEKELAKSGESSILSQEYSQITDKLVVLVGTQKAVAIAVRRRIPADV
jgi:hypothetical protein